MFTQYNYTIEYRPTKQHGNADALSRLPAGPNLSFDGEEGDNDVDTVCTIRTISSQLQPYKSNQIKIFISINNDDNNRYSTYKGNIVMCVIIHLHTLKHILLRSNDSWCVI